MTMKQSNFDDKLNDNTSKVYMDKIRLFITGLGAFFALVFTYVAFLIVFAFFVFDKQMIEKSKLLSNLIIPALYLIYYSVVTTKVINASLSYKLRQFIKRFFDVILSAFGLFLLLPIFLVIAIAIKIDSPGPILLRSKKVGQFGKLFDVYKFRTMHLAPKEIPITRVGKFLRRFSIDELPMLYNVLEGELSFVGPWPRYPKYLEKTIDADQKILLVKPGMTGLWQISKSNANELIEYDLKYIEEWSLFLDIKILLKTSLVVLFDEDYMRLTPR